MLILKGRSAGFTLIEVMCSIAVFSILFLTALSIKLAEERMKVYNDKVLQYTTCIETVKNEMISNMTCDEVVKLYDSDKVFINRENLNIDSLKSNNISELFSEEQQSEMPYIQMSVEDGQLQHINIKMYTRILNKIKILSCEFHKGRD